MARRPVGRPVAPGIATRPPSALRRGARPGGGIRRTPKVRRRSAGLTPVRAGALLALLVALTGLYGATRSDAFTVRRTAITGAAWTSEEALRSALAIPAGQNLFTLGTRELERRLVAMPGIRGASVSVVLPDEVRVAVAERVPLLAWKVGDLRYLVDEDGYLFARVEGSVARTGRGAPRHRRQPPRGRGPRPWVHAGPGGPRCRPAPGLAQARGPRHGRHAPRHPRRRRGRLRHEGRPGRLVGNLRLLHADASDHRADPGPGPPVAQLARAGGGGHGRQGDPGRRPERHPDPAPEPVADSQGLGTRRPRDVPPGVSGDPGVW